MKDDRKETLQIGSDKVVFLEDVAKKYSLPDIGKAVRCLIDYARDNPDKHEEIFNEPRCLDC